VNRKWWPITCIAGVLGIAGALPASAGPAEAALAHMEKILNRNVKLEVGTDTAISPHVSQAKEEQIRDHLKRMALDLQDGELEAGNIRVDGKLAGVIIHKRQGYDPEKVAAFAVALVNTGDRWLPAPVSASFENTGISLDLDLRRRAADLERWMLRERSAALDILRDERADDMRRDIGAAITRAELEKNNVREIATAFIDAVRNHDRLRLLGLLGGLSDPLPRNWATRLESVDLAMAPGGQIPHGWRAVGSPEIPRAIVHEESGPKDALFTIGYIDPAAEVPRGGVPAVRLLHIDMERDEGGAWRLNLPAPFREAELTDILTREENNPFDVELLDAFPQRLRETHPAAPQSTPEALWEKLRLAITADRPDDLLRLLDIPHDNPEQARTAMGRATRFWWQMRPDGGGRTVAPLAFIAEDDQAMAMAQLFAFREPERTDLRTFHMVRTADGWMWQSTGRQEPPVPVSPTIAAWRDQQEEQWRNTWTAAILAPAAKIDKLADQPAPDPAAATALVRKWLDAIAASDINAALANSAVLDDGEGHARLLRNLGYELSRKLTDVDGGIITRSGKHWTVVCYRRLGDANPGMALMPVITTAAGPLLLPELDLFVGTRQREFLNNVALERLDAYADAQIRGDLQSLLQSLNRELEPLRR